MAGTQGVVQALSHLVVLSHSVGVGSCTGFRVLKHIPANNKHAQGINASHARPARLVDLHASLHSHLSPFCFSAALMLQYA